MFVCTIYTYTTIKRTNDMYGQTNLTQHNQTNEEYDKSNRMHERN